MDFSTQLDLLNKHAAEANSTVRAAVKESRQQIHERIDQVQGDGNSANKDVRMEMDDASAGASSKWAQMKVDASAKMDDLNERMTRRSTQLSAKGAEAEAQWAEDDASAAIDYAVWAVDNARLAALDAIDARLNADELARSAS